MEGKAIVAFPDGSERVVRAPCPDVPDDICAVTVVKMGGRCRLLPRGDVGREVVDALMQHDPAVLYEDSELLALTVKGIPTTWISTSS